MTTETTPYKHQDKKTMNKLLPTHFLCFINKHRQSGFTIIEIMIAITVFAIGILAINIMQTSSIKGNSTSNGISVSTNVATKRIEQIIADTYTNLKNGSDNTTNAYPATWSVSTDTPIKGVKSVSITVSRNDRGTTKDTVLNFAKADKI